MIVEDDTGRRKFEFQRGPVFTQICLADEINRATPKTQSALLETMQEGTVTAGGQRHVLSKTILCACYSESDRARRNLSVTRSTARSLPIKLVVGYSSREELNTIIDRTTQGTVIQPEKVMDGDEIKRWQGLVRQVILAPHVRDYISRLVLATHPEGTHAAAVTNQHIRWGSSPRAGQAIALASKVRALLDGRFNVAFEDVRRTYLPAMRHRIVLNFEAQAEGIEADQVLLQILETVSEKSDT